VVIAIQAVLFKCT